MYTSTTTLMPPENGSSNSNLMSLLSSAAPASGVGSAALGMKTTGAEFVGIMGSRTVQESLVKRFDLVHHYKGKLVEDACTRLKADTTIHEDPRSGIITISVKADDTVLASNIASGYVTELDRIVTNNSTSAARRERIFLEGRLSYIKNDLDNSAKTLSQFSAKSRTIDVPSQGKAMMDFGLRLQDQMVVARADLAGLKQSYSEDNAKVRAARAQIAVLQRQIDKTMGSTEGPSLDGDNSVYPSVRELPALGLTYSDLERRIHVEEALWDALTRQYEAARVQEAKEIPTVRILDVADVPQRKSSSARKNFVLLGTLFSFFIAGAFVYFTEFWANLDTQDERRTLVREIADEMRKFQARVFRLPGLSWARARLLTRR
jgi:capsule polysaccharide export protein KpsE/RkpR